MMAASSTQIAVLVLALLLGVALAYSSRLQLSLRRRAHDGGGTASLFKRLMMAGVTLLLLTGIVLAAKHLSDFVPKSAFMTAAYGAALATFVLRLRSNTLVERTGQQQPAAHRRH